MAMELPDLEPFFNPWQEYEDHIYTIFLETMVEADIKFNGLPVSCPYRPESKGKHFSFWHLISEGKEEDERTPDFQRCERIRWFSWLINNVEEFAEITWWENRRGKNTHVVIWLEKEDFAVILAKRSSYYVIKTAYIVKSKRANTFRKERKEYWES